MQKFYEEKGHKIFIWVMLGLIVITTFLVIFGEYASFKQDMANMDESLKKTNELVVQQVKKDKKTYNGQIEYMEGEVEKRNGASAGWFSAVKSDVLKSGDEVRTLANSRAIITIEDGSVVRLNENTHIIFDGQNENIIIAMDKGFVYNNVAKDNNRVYTVKTGEYEVKALGTEFSVEGDELGVDVMVVESAVHVTDTNKNINTTVKEGNKVKVTGDTIKENAIVQEDLEDEFIVWSTEDEKDEDITKDVVKEEKKQKKEENDDKKDEVNTKGSIVLSGEKSSSGVRLHWEVNGVNTSKGFKVVKSKEINPVYPGSDYKYLSDSGVRDYKWKMDNGKKYHFRVCAYLGDGKCGVYSNDIEVRAPEGDDEDDDKEKSDGDYATGVSLKAEADGDEVKLKWEISGGNAPKGFKVVKSKEKNPKYPGDDYKYLSDGDKRKYTWENLKEGKTYHFRVCIYKGGKCGAYSNDVKVEL
jgi:hypothetical protein